MKERQVAIRKLRIVGGSLVVTVPKKYSDDLNWKDGDHIAISVDGQSLRISKVKMEVIK